MWECAEFRIDFDAGLAEKAGIEVRLTPTEWGLLQALAATPGQLVRRADLLHAVGADYDRETNYLRVYFALAEAEADPARPRPSSPCPAWASTRSWTRSR
ncbi:MAG: winged helix-turn-helix domain-containing protein [Marmoricola sp.]